MSIWLAGLGTLVGLVLWWSVGGDAGAVLWLVCIALGWGLGITFDLYSLGGHIEALYAALGEIRERLERHFPDEDEEDDEDDWP